MPSPKEFLQHFQQAIQDFDKDYKFETGQFDAVDYENQRDALLSAIDSLLTAEKINPVLNNKEFKAHLIKAHASVKAIYGDNLRLFLDLGNPKVNQLFTKVILPQLKEAKNIDLPFPLRIYKNKLLDEIKPIVQFIEDKLKAEKKLRYTCPKIISKMVLYPPSGKNPPSSPTSPPLTPKKTLALFPGSKVR